jgi:hypothetical protein
MSFEKCEEMSDLIKSKNFLKNTEITENDLREIGMENITNFKLNGKSLLFRAMSFRKGNGLRKDILDEIIIHLIETFPDLITLEQFPESNESTGVTPIHLAVVQEDTELLKTMAKHTQKMKKRTMIKK